MPIPSIRDIWNNALQTTNAIREKRPHLTYQNNTGRLDSSAEMENISANASADPQQYKQQAVLNATERKRKQLGLTQELNKQEDTALRLAGRTEEYVQANAQQRAILQNMTDEERADNYVRYKANDPSAIPDKYIDQDFHNLSDMELEARYGTGIGEIKRRDAINTLGLAQQATQQSLHSGLDRPWYNPTNILGSFISGAGKTIDGTGDLLEAGRGALEGDMAKAYENINKHGVGNNIQDFGESLLSSDWQAANARNRALDALDEKVVNQIAASNELGGLDATEARRQANDIVDSVALDRLPDARDIYQQSLEQVPELLAGAGIGALARKGATVGARAVINNAVRKAADKVGDTARNKALKEATEDLAQTRISSVGKQQAQNNISTYGKKGVTKEDVSSRIGLGEKIEPHKEAIKSKAKHDINNSSLVQQELKNKAKDISDKFIRRSQNAVDNKAAKIGDIAGRVGVGAYFGGREGSSAAGDAYKQVKDMNASYVASSPEGKKLKEQHPDWTDEQIQEQIAQNAASTAFGRQGATSFVSGTIFSGAESRLFGHGRAGTFKGAVKNTAGSIAGEVPQEYAEEYGGTYNPRVAINKALGKEHFKEDTGDLRSKAHVRGVQGAITAAGSTTLTNAHELIPTGLKESTAAVTSKVKDITANQRAKKENQEIQQASVTDTGSKTNFGKAVESTNEELANVQGVEENHPLGKAIKEGNFSKIVSEFSKEAKAAQTRIDSGKSENVENDQAIIDSYNTYKEKITNAIGEDFKSTRESIEADIDKVVEAINVDEDVMNGIANLLQTDPSIIAKTEDGSIDQFQTVINATQKLNPKLYDNFVKALNRLDDFEDAARILETPSIRTLTETNKQQSTDNSIGSTDDIRSGQTGNVGTITTRQLSRINADLENEVKELENLDKNSEDYATRVKDFATKANNLILSLPTIQSSLEASESKQAWNDIAKYLSTLRNAAKQYDVKLDNNALLTRLHKTISDINKLIRDQNLSDKEAKTLFDKFVGSKGKKGLLTYVQESFSGNGLSPRGVYQLSHFLATQNAKHKTLGLIADILKNVDSGSFRPFKYKNPTLKRSTKGKQQNELDDVYFETMEQFHKYYQTTGREVKIFNDLASSILKGEELTFGASAKNTEKSEDTGFTPTKEDEKVKNEITSFERNERNKQSNTTQNNPNENSKKVKDFSKKITKLFNDNAPEDVVLGNMAGTSIIRYAEDRRTGNKGRYIVMVDFGHTKLPFYFSSGLAGKKKVAAKQWYPIFGLDFKSGWLAKGTQDQINAYYGITKLKETADVLSKVFNEDFLNNNLENIPYFDDPSRVVLDEKRNPITDNSSNHPALQSKFKLEFSSPIFESIANQTGRYDLNLNNESTLKKAILETREAFRKAKETQQKTNEPVKELNISSYETGSDKKANTKQSTVNSENSSITNTNSVQESTKSTETTTKNNGSNKLKDKLKAVYSGGAYGADGIWDSMLRKFGVDSTTIKHFVLGQSANIKNKQLNTENVNDTVVDQIKNLANNTQNKVLANYLNRLLQKHNTDQSDNKYVSKLLLRNVLQVSNSNGVFGVMPIVDGKLGKSGTKVAIELGAISNRPTYVLNTEDNQWYSVSYSNGNFNVSPLNGIPTITSKPTLVGTREIESYYKNGELTPLHRNTDNILNAMEYFLLLNNGKFAKPEEITISLSDNSIGDVQENFQENQEENQNEIIESESQVEDSTYQDPDEAEFKHTQSVDESKLNPTQKHLLNNRSYVKHILDRIWQQGKNSGKLDDSSFMGIRVFWRSIGLNYDVDFFKTAKFKVRNLIGSDKLNAVRNLNSKSTPEERINAYGDMFGIEPDVLKDLSNEEKFAVVSYANAYVGLKENIDKYFTKLPDAITKLRLKDITPLQAKLRPTALLNFVQFQAADNNENGKWFFGDDFKQAMTNALIKTFQEEGQRSTKTSQVIENLTRGHERYNVIEMNNHLGLTDEALNQKVIASDPTVNIKSLDAKAAILGSNKEQFIETLGRNALDRLGVVLDPKESKSNQGIIGSLGQELFNALLEMGVVEVNRVQYYDYLGYPAQYIDHVNFSWNTGFEQSKPEENSSREWFKASRSSQNNQSNKYAGNTNAKHFAGIKTGFNSIAHNTLFPEAKQNYNGVRVTTDGSANPFTVTNRDIETELTSGNNDEAKSYVQALNNIPYKPNTDFYNFFKNGLGELGKAVLGYTDVSLLDTTDRIKDKFISKNSQIDRDIDILETYFNNPSVEGNIDKLRFFIKHRLMSNQRIQFEGALNPQSSKNIRQMLVQDSKHATTTFKPTKSIKEFFEGLSKSNNAHELGYGLAVAQALGVKIERVYDTEAFNEMAKLFGDSNHIFNKMVGLITKVEETGNLPENAQEIVTEFSGYGNEAMRVLHTAFTVAQYNKALKSGSDFKSHLTIEADGIGNGVHNSLRQFAIGFTPAYFHSLKRTGVVTLDLAYKAMLEEKKDLDMIEGAKHIFRKDPKGKDNIDDVYEAVSSAVADSLNIIRTNLPEYDYSIISNKNYNSLIEIIDDHELLQDATLDLKQVHPSELEEEKVIVYAAKHLLQHARSLVLLDAIGKLDIQLNGEKIDLVRTDFKDLTSKNIALSVARAFAKAGVTPANYGGKLEGITKQLRSDISKTLDDLAEKAYKKAKDTSNVSPDEVKEANIQLRLLAKALMPLTLNQIDFTYQAKTREDVARNANIIANAFVSSPEVHQNLKDSLGQLMQNAIDKVYQEQFDAIDFAISADNALFYEFEEEFNNAYRQKIKQRNIKKKWATYDNNGNIDEYLDPRANDGLTKGEIKDILANMHNSPVIATAMSKNTVLINQLFNAGNSLIKTSKSISLEDKRVVYTSRPSEVAKNANGNLTVIGTTIRDAYRKFDPAGAAALVQSVVSTESATQGRLATELAKDGLYVLDVFDGAEMPPHMRQFIGNKINELTNQVHLETRLMEAFFHKLNRSGLAESIQKINFDNVDGLVRLAHYGTSAVVRPKKIRINKDNVKFLNAYTAMEIGRLLYMRLNNPTDKDTTGYLDNMKIVRGIAQRFTEALANGKSEISLTRNDIFALGLSGINKVPTNNHLNSKYNNYLRQFADLAARSRAMKDIEATYLPAVINQFGGVSNGYAHLKESKLAKQTLDAFRDWLTKEGLEVADINMRTQQGSDVLSKFVMEHFKDELNQKRAYYGKQLSPNYIKSNVLNTKFTTVGDFINGVIENSGTKDSTINPTLANTIKALVEPIKQIVGENTKIYTNKKEFEDKFGKIQDKYSTGTYIGLINDNKIEHGIFVSEDGDVVTALHEILHGIQEGYFNSYVKNPDNLDSKVRAAIDDLKTIALDVASLYKNNPEVAKLLEQANKLKENSISLYNNNDSLMASMANITYVFSPEAAKSIPAEQLANAQVVALKEFWAYSLSQPEILNRLRYSGVRGRKDKLSLLDKLVNLFKQMRTRVAQAFGFTNGKEAPNSYLIDALAAINVIGQRAEDSTKYKDIKTYSLNDLDTVQLSRVKVKPQNELLFQVAGLTASTTNKPATQVFKDIVDTSFNISPGHGEHLQDLFDTVMNGIQAHKDSGKPIQLNHATAWAMLKNNDLDSTANEIIRDLSKVGMVMNDAEKTAFKLMYAVNKASYDSNHQLAIETQNLMNNITRHIEPNKFLDNGALVYDGSDKFNTVFNNKRDPNNQMAMVMALATTHEEFRNYLQRAITQDKPKGIKRFNKKLAEAFNQATLYSDIANQITGFKDKTIVDKLNLVAAGLEFKNNVGDISRQQQQNDLLLAQVKQLEAADFVNDLANGLPNQTVRNLVKGVGGFVLSGKGLTADDADSTFRKMVQDIIDDIEYINERPTIFTKVWRWFMGAYDQTQLAYKLRSQNAVLSDAVREKVGNAITASIESEFSELSDTDRKALSKAVMPIRLHALFNLRGHLKVSVPQILSDAQVHQNEINAFKQELSSKVAQILPSLNPVQQQQVVNYLNWQTAGLGELMVKGIAKGSKNTTHGILPNVRAIGAMVQLKSLNAQFKRSIDAVSLQDMADLVDVLQGLATLQALRYVSQSDKDTVAKLFQNERKGMKALLAELTDMDENALKVDPYGLLGYDGYVHNKRNPNADIQVLSNVTPEQHQELMYLGWEHSMTLPNGEAVYTTQNSLRNNWTTGAFGTSELNSFGANVVTGRSLRSTGSEVSPQLKLGKELQQRFTKILATQDYYDTLNDYSHYRPIIDRTGSISGFEVDVSNEQRDSVIASLENDIASTGNYQARLVEEGITAKNNNRAIDALNHAYQQATDKSRYIKIDGKAKPRSNNPADVQFAKRLNDFFYMLPESNRAKIIQDGLYVHRHEVDNLIGYYQASTADIFLGTSGLPEPVQKAFKAVAYEMYRTFGVKSPAVLLRQAGRFTGEFASLTKDFILNRSMIVPAQNLLSNVLQLITVGIPVKQVVPLMIEGYRNAKAYTENQSRIIALEHELAIRNLNASQQAKHRAEILSLINANNRNPAKVLIQNGILTSVTDLSITNDREDSQFSLFNTLSDKYGISKVRQQVPQGIRELLIQDGTKMHNAMMALMDYGDFVAKYALYQHMTKSRGLDSEHAINVIRDEFVDYAMNRGREFDWANKIGLTWFLSYKLAIQKIFFRNLRRNALRTMAVWGSSRLAGELTSGVPLVRDVIGETVNDQIYPIKHSLYHITPHHTDIIDAHWIHKVLEAF